MINECGNEEVNDNYSDIVLCSSEDLNNLKQDLISTENLEMAKEFLCVICLKLIYQPVSCKNCQNIFCKLCRDKRKENKLNCSKNCEEIDYQTLDKNSINLLNKIKLKCPSNNCEEKVLYENLESHLKECPFKKYKCEYCEYRSNIKDCLNHVKECSLSFKECEYCREKIKKKNSEVVHSINVCLINLLKKRTDMLEKIPIMKKENEDLENEIKIHKFPLEEIEKVTKEIKELRLPGRVKEDFIYDIRKRIKQERNINNISIKYVEKFENLYALVIFEKNMNRIIFVNLTPQEHSVKQFPQMDVNIADWFLIKSLNLICLITTQSCFLFFDIYSGNLVQERVLPINFNYDNIYFNEKIGSLVIIYPNLIKVYKLTFDKAGISIKIETTQELNCDYQIGCYLKHHHYFLTIEDTYLKIYSIEDQTKILDRDISYKMNKMKEIKQYCLYFKENSLFVVLQYKDLVFLDYSNGGIKKIVKNVTNEKVLALKKAKLNKKRHFISCDTEGFIRVWDIEDFNVIIRFSIKSYSHLIEFSNKEEGLIVLDRSFNIRGWKLENLKMLNK